MTAKIRSSAWAADELPDGIGWSSKLRGRTTSDSWSEAVSKNPPPLGVAERSTIIVGERARLHEPARLEGRLVQHQQRLGQERVVLEVGIRATPGRPCTCAAGARRASRISLEQELGALARGVEVVGAPERRAGVGERRQHQRVPGGQALVVEARPHALRAHVVQRCRRARASTSGSMSPPST